MNTSASKPTTANNRRATVPDRPSIDGLASKWAQIWEDDGTYKFDRGASREEVFSIDTPPPTVSGSLHIGHVFSYTHTDVVARFHRMRGKSVFYPMGWDDNGLPTERRVQNYFGVRCDPSLAPDPDFEPPKNPGKDPVAISRPDFVDLCETLKVEDERAFETLWRALGLSVDWSLTYATIDERSRRASQRSFLRLLESGDIYQCDAPTLWDVDFQTAVSQAELEERERPGAYHLLRFNHAFGDGFVDIDTTRPELLAACVALVAHPDDPRYASLFGKEVITPLFGVRIPVLSHELADPEKGTGIAMVCTFGDTTDVTWWKDLKLPTRNLVGRDGRFRAVAWGHDGFESTNDEHAARIYAEIQGKTIRQAQARIVEILKESGSLVGEPRPITHPVKFFEKGERPLEIVSSRQWFVRTLPLRERLLELGSKLRWHPSYMEHRFRSWVEALNSDWNVSRQRFFGVPIPLWYRVTQDGSTDFETPILASNDDLPVDPSTDVPVGFTAAQRDVPGGFRPDPDVMDTWATSSLTPQIAGGWVDDPELFAKVFPMDLRPQAHDIIRTWLFTTVVRSELEHGELPWRDVAVSGWVLDPDRKKMSKSKGNVVTPLPLVERHGPDAVRYWAAKGRPGTDTAVDEGQMKVGRRLAIKVLNASKFVLGQVHDDSTGGTRVVTEPLDASMLARLSDVVDGATAALDAYDYTRALDLTETFFWTFCDDYLELVKVRSYGGDADVAPEAVGSARAALEKALSVQLRLFAPFLPFVTEEIWSWFQLGSIHRARWPRASELTEDGSAPRGPRDLGSEALGSGEGSWDVYDVASSVLGEIRRTKSTEKRSMRARVSLVEVTDTQERIAALETAAYDLVNAGNVAETAFRVGSPAKVNVTLEEVE